MRRLLLSVTVGVVMVVIMAASALPAFAAATNFPTSNIPLGLFRISAICR